MGYSFYYLFMVANLAVFTIASDETPSKPECPSGILELNDCLPAFRGTLGQCVAYTYQVGELRETMEEINEGFKNINEADSLVKYVPGIEDLVKVAKKKIQPIQVSFTTAYNAIVAVDEKCQGLQEKCEAAVIDSDIVKAALEILYGSCSSQSTPLGSQQKCLLKYTQEVFDQMSPEELQNFFEGEDKLSGCNDVQNFTKALSQRPAIDDILTALDVFQKDLIPILQFFFKIREGLNTQLCLLTPKARDPSSESWWANWGIKDMWDSWFDPKSDSKKSIKRKYWNNISYRRRFIQIGRGGKAVKDVCISVKDVQDGIKGPLSERAQQILDAAVTEIPSADISFKTPDFDKISKFGSNLDAAITDGGLQTSSVNFRFTMTDCTKKAWTYCQEPGEEGFSIEDSC